MNICRIMEYFLRNSGIRVYSLMMAVLLSVMLSGCSLAESAVDHGEELFLGYVANQQLKDQKDTSRAEETAGLAESEGQKTEEAGAENLLEVKNTPDPEECYYYQSLDAKTRQLYDDFLQGLGSHREQIMLDTRDEDLIYHLYEMILADHPELFWVDGGYSYIAGRMNMNVLPEYTCTVDEAEGKQKKIVRAARAILKELKAQGLTTDYDKVKAVFEYVVYHVDYNTESTDNQNVYSALVNHVSVCAGYAKMTQYLLQQLGIQTLYLSGEVENQGSHAWNMVLCNGRYYLVDSTYGDCVFEDESVREFLPEEFTCDYNYLCCSERLLMQDRTVNSWGELPSCDNEDLNYYALTGRYYDAVDDEMIEDMENSILSGDEFWTCQFSNRAAYDDFMQRIQESFYLKKVLNLLELEQVQGYSTYNEHFLSVSCWYEK